MPHPLVIVESPAKAKTIAGYLGDDYVVESSIGHIRDLPSKAAEIPAAYKKEKWSSMGIDVDNDFKPLYVVSDRKSEQVKKLKNLLKDASELVLATDEDREGEAIAWHLLEVLNPAVPVKRMVFHEITPEAIRRAIDNPRELDRRLVDAQEARRLLDRLYGYEVSPVLWKKVKPRLSAGRVQSVATRIVVERERERMAFRSANYWDLTATFSASDPKHAQERPFSAVLLELDGARIATGRDFAQDGTIQRQGVIHLDKAQADALAAELRDQPAEVTSREAKPYRRTPAAPFITSTYQQEASRKLRLSSSQAMRVAQGLYERGYITYMRTDSTTLSEAAVGAARAQIAEKYGAQYLPDGPRVYRTKAKNAQEAHEAIRPAGDTFRTPGQVSAELSAPELRVYELIWQRTVASQMTDATGETVTLKLSVASTAGRDALFSTSGTVISHQGFLKVYVESKDDAGDHGDAEADEKRLPALEEGDRAELTSIDAAGHDTQAPSRFTEASLVKKLEELEVGRPSTYASIMTTIQDRGYVWKKGSALVPSFLAFAVITLLEQHFPDLVDYAFTARMEGDLDNIADGTEDAVPWLSQFYFGADEEPGLRDKVADRLGDIDARAVNSIPIGVDDDGIPIIARVGQFGPYLERGRLGGFTLSELPSSPLSGDGSPSQFGSMAHWEPTVRSKIHLRRNLVGDSTGREVLICGHRETSRGPLLDEPIDGAIYAPADGTWRPISECSWIGTPAAAVWTGDTYGQLVVLGAAGGGAAYEPATDSWKTLPPEVATPVGFRAALWTGEKVLGVGWGKDGIAVTGFDPGTGFAEPGTMLEVAVSDAAVATWTGREVLVWDRAEGWFYDPVADTWREAPVLGKFDGKLPKESRALAAGPDGSVAIYAVAWFKTAERIRLAKLEGDSWRWLDDLEIEGHLAAARLVDGEIVITGDDVPVKAYRFVPSSEELIPFDSFPSRAVRDHSISAVSLGPDAPRGLMVWGNLIETKAIPNDVTPDELNVTRSMEIMAVPDVIQLGHHPDNGLPVLVRDGKFGPYVQLGEMPKKVTEDNKPQTSSLFKDMKMEELTLDQALQLLSIPRVVGVDPSDGLEITARNGPHGPYLTKPPPEEGKRADTRSFENEADLLTMTLEQAVALYTQPKRRRGQSAAGPLKELGIDPTTDLPVVVKSGQFGEYVTDGEVNASLTATDTVERIDITRASELLATRRQKMALEPGGSKKAGKKATAKRGAAKKSTAKKSTAKRGGSKAAAKR
ncbi:MAG: type I DNA topoisomerase [Acidimicrobiales bacterium]